jgi:hypothetical protein
LQRVSISRRPTMIWFQLGMLWVAIKTNYLQPIPFRAFLSGNLLVTKVTQKIIQRGLLSRGLRLTAKVLDSRNCRGVFSAHSKDRAQAPAGICTYLVSFFAGPPRTPRYPVSAVWRSLNLLLVPFTVVLTGSKSHSP